MDLPKHNSTAHIERKGINAVASAIIDKRLIWRETPNSDVGIDGQIEYVDSQDFATGQIIAVQVKSGASYFEDDCGDAWRFYPEQKHRNYWEQFPVPVYLILHDPTSKLSYWVDARRELRLPGPSKKAIFVPKTNTLESTNRDSLFEAYSIRSERFLGLNDVLKYIVEKRNQNASFPVSFFELFCCGLTNICRTLYYSMDVATLIAEENLSRGNFDYGIGISASDHDFLFEYIQFLIHQNIAYVDYSDCLIDWIDRQLQPNFMAPLTTRGRELVDLIQSTQRQYKSAGDIESRDGLYAAQEAFVNMPPIPSLMDRLDVMSQFLKAYNHSEASNG